MSQKSYDGKPTLYLVATPIGNMDDITFRAIDILKNVEVIFSEDTRVTNLLLKKFDIHKKLISSHQYNERENDSKLLSYLNEGKDVALVTDRGTPVISDPGYELSKIAIENGYNVVSIPGATALISALIVSNIAPLPFTFLGFLSSKQGKRRKELEKLKKHEYTMIFYESPHRLKDTLNDMQQILGNRKCCISREITKKFEEIYRGNLNDVISQMDEVKGEIVIVLEGNTDTDTYDDIDILDHIDIYINQGYNQKEAIKMVAKQRGLKKNDVYMKYHSKD